MIKLIKTICVVMVIMTISSIASFNSECKQISNKVLRFHVLANSNSQEDQDLKIKVRDSVLEFSETLFEKADSKESAINIASTHLSDIIQRAQNEVYANGYDYTVNGCVTNMYFNTRVYDNYTLPAGKYDTVRLTIGNGEGKNWWCVMFPMLCVPCAEKSIGLDDVLNEDELDIVEGGEKYEIKFKIVEIYEGLADWISTHF